MSTQCSFFKFVVPKNAVIFSQLPNKRESLLVFNAYVHYLYWFVNANVHYFRVFSMFQQPEFNRLLFYQMLESTLDTIFPDNKVKHTLSLLRTKINNKANTEQRVK